LKQKQGSETENLVLAAIVSAGAMIAFQVGGKATRDAVFLSNFPVTALPMMLVASAAVSILAVLASSRLISRSGPGAVVPAAFAASSILLVAEWMAYSSAPRATATVFYLHMAAFGAVLVSGFWSTISELLDPRTAKASIGRIASGGTLGGLIGGVIAERTGAMVSVSAILPVLAVFHLVCAVLNRRLRLPQTLIPRNLSERSDSTKRTSLDALRAVPYLTPLAVLVLLGTVAEALLDYVLKAHAMVSFSQTQQLLRFFALFYTGISLVTFLIQAALTRYALQQFGLTTTMSTMPFVLVAGGVGSLIWPGILSTGLVRGAQSVLRRSLFLSGYELLFAPVPPAEKRAAKSIVDVGFDKLGDAVAAGLIFLVLSAGLSALANSRLLTLGAVLIGAVSLVLTPRLRRGYVATLEKSLLNRAADLDLIDFEERTARSTMLRTLGTVDLGLVRRAVPIKAERLRQPVTQGPEASALTRRILDLQSEDATVVRAALTSEEVLDPLLIAPAIRLLARDDVSEDAVRALRNTVAATVGQLTDALLSTDEDFAIRRRIPRVLAYCTTARAVDSLMLGLADSRFEVRFSCGRGLSRICSVDPTLRPPAESVYAATLREITTAKRLSELPRVLDHYEEVGSSSGETLWNSTDLRLEHIFRLLSLSLTREPLHIAFQALHTDDNYLKGTALEYLESILPTGIRENLLHFLEGPPRKSTDRRPANHIAEELMRSRQQIEVKLSLARRTSSDKSDSSGSEIDDAAADS
jgi:AAA family ATP:ADP antiporter